MSGQKKKGLTLEKKHNLTGWMFLLPATLLIAWMSFYPMIQAFILSLQKGVGLNLQFCGFDNYVRIFKDKIFTQTLFNTFFYLIIQVPIMLVLGLALAEQQRSAFQGTVPYLYFPSMCNITGSLLFDFPFSFCKRWIYQCGTPKYWNGADSVVW